MSKRGFNDPNNYVDIDHKKIQTGNEKGPEQKYPETSPRDI
jgi:hypothetical protein